MNAKRLKLLPLLFAVLMLGACGGGGGGGGGGDGGSSSPPLDPPATNLTGTWDILESISGNCPNQRTSDQYSVTVTQSGNNLTVVTPNGTFSGTISGSTVGWTGSYFDSDLGGTVTITAMTLTASADGNRLSGTASWTFSATNVTCSGTTQVTATRRPGTGPVPQAPANLTATPGTLSVTLNWSHTGDDELGFKIERSSDGTNWPTNPLTQTLQNVTSFVDSAVVAGTTYFYRVRAYNANGNSAPSNVESAVPLPPPATAPAAPTNLTAAAISTTAIALQWTDNSGNETGFKIERRVGASGTFQPLTTTPANNTNIASYTDSGLTPGTTYTYRVRATNASGDSANSNEASATTLSSVGAPVLTGPSTSTGSITLTWTYDWSGGLVSTSDGYELQESSTSPTTGFSTIFSTLNQNDRQSPKSHTISRSNGTYHYRVRARKNSTFSNWSNVLSVTVQVAARQITLRNLRSTVPDRLNEVVQVKVAAVEGTPGSGTGVFVRSDLLTDDGLRCLDIAQIDSILPGQSRTFNVTVGNDYYVFIGVGIWETDLFFCLLSRPWVKTTYFVDANLNQYYPWVTVKVTGHTSGNWEWKVEGSYLNNTLRVTPAGGSPIPFKVTQNANPIR